MHAAGFSNFKGVSRMLYLHYQNILLIDIRQSCSDHLCQGFAAHVQSACTFARVRDYSVTMARVLDDCEVTMGGDRQEWRDVAF